MPRVSKSGLGLWRRRVGARLRRIRDIWASEGPAIGLKAAAAMAAASLSEIGRRRAGTAVSARPRLPPLHPGAALAPPEAGVLFIGYVESALGLGQSLRGLIGAAAEAGAPFGILPYHFRAESRRIGTFMPERYASDRRFAVNVVEVAPDQVDDALSALGEARLAESYNILRTYWELPAAPAEWRRPLAAFDEIWAPSAFVGEAMRAVFDGPITPMRPAVSVDAEERARHSGFALAPGVFRFLFSFDVHSHPARKNPLSVVRAFRLAFPDEAADVGLVIKLSGAPGLFAEHRAALRAWAARDRRIRLIDADLDRGEMLALIEACDCYVSLHRAEGLGLGMIEAMLLGRPVIATDHSGNRDFLDDATGFPVRCDLVEVRAHEYPHAAGQRWADPDLAHAAELMRLVESRRDFAKAKGEAGRARAESLYGSTAVGAALKERLAAIAAAGPGS